jgi:hypothetical protein
MSEEEVIKVKRPDLVSLLFEERFPYPQIRLLIYKGNVQLGIKKEDGSILIEFEGKWMTVEDLEGELLKRFR